MNQERTPKWDKWRHVPDLKIWEAVALSLNIEPGKVKHHKHGWMAGAHLFEEDEEFSDRIDVAGRNLGRNLEATAIQMGSATNSSVSLPAFAAWAISIQWNIPAELSELAALPLAQRLPVSEMLLPNDRNHVSDKLAKMNQASARFWSNADRSNRATHPDNATVAAWLVKHDFSSTLADKAATIIRPEWAPTGRKPEE